jgi:hypothetical protein
MTSRSWFSQFRATAVLALALILTVSAVQAQDIRHVNPSIAAQDPIFVVLDGYQISAEGQNPVFDVPPVIFNGVTFVEVNGLFSEMGISLTWYGDERRVRGVGPDQTVIDLYIGNTTAYVDGVAHTLPVAPFIAAEYGRTMVPISFVASQMNANVTWIGGQRTIYIQQDTPFKSMRNFSRAWQVASHTYRGYGSYGHTGPISLSQAILEYQNGDPNEFIWLVGLSGTDTNRSSDGSAVGPYQAFVTGLLNARNDYLINVLRRIEEQIQGNTANPTRLVLAGHSLGGMVAQQVASEMKFNQKWDGYKVLNTVAFGSPLLDFLKREGHVRRLGDTHDPVPLLSLEGALLEPINVGGTNWETAPGFGLAALPLHNWSYQMAGTWDNYDALGYKYGTARIRFRPGNTTFYTAPVLESALEAVQTGEPQRVETEPDAFVLEGVAPNPVQGYAVIRYDLPEAADVQIELYDILGRRVKTLLDASQAPGYHTVPVDATSLPAGTYLYRLTAGSEMKTGRMTVVR